MEILLCKEMTVLAKVLCVFGWVMFVAILIPIFMFIIAAIAHFSWRLKLKKLIEQDRQLEDEIWASVFGSPNPVGNSKEE